MKKTMRYICGLTEKDLRIFTNGVIYRFKASILEEPPRIRKFDVCGRCLSRIADEIRNAEAGEQE